MTSSAIDQALRTLAQRPIDDAAEAEAAFAAVLDGRATDAQTGALLTAMRIWGESVPLLVGAARAVRKRMVRIEVPSHLRPLIDTCGTGGDGARSFNISTAVALVVAACGVRVAKHGNRSASGNCGSAELLAELGLAVEAEPGVVTRCLEEVGIAFLFAPRYHPALRTLAAVRKQLPFRTIFNLVGPLVNPALPEHQLIGAPAQHLVPILAAACRELHGDSPRGVAVVHGDDGLDEVTLYDNTTVAWLAPGRDIEHRQWRPDQFGIPHHAPPNLTISGPAESAARLHELLAGRSTPVREIVLANAAAALVVAGKVAEFPEGTDLAARALDRGDAARLLARWIELSHSKA